MGPVQDAFHGIKKFLSHGFAFEKKVDVPCPKALKKVDVPWIYMFLKIKCQKDLYTCLLCCFVFIKKIIKMLFCTCEIDAYLLHIGKLQAT